MKMLFSTFEMAGILGIRRERFINWLKSGFVSATYPSPGRGIAAMSTMEDLYKTAIFELMIKFLKRKEAAKYIAQIGKQEFTYKIFYLYRFNGIRLICGQMPNEYENPLIYVINFEKIKREIDAKLQFLIQGG